MSPHARLPSPNTQSRTLDPPPLAGAAVSSTPAPGSSRHPLALSRAEYHALYAETHQKQRRRSVNAPEPTTSQAQQPESAEVLSQQTKVTRPRTPPLPMPTASQASVVSASFSPTVAAAQKSPKPRKSRLRKRRAEDACQPAVSTAKQAPASGPELPYPATRASSKSAAAASSSADATVAESLSAVPKPASCATHADLQQFARPPSRESLESPRRPLQIAEPFSRTDRTPTHRAKSPSLPDVTTSAEPVIVLNDDTPFEHALDLQGDEEGAWDEPAHADSAHETAAQAVVNSHSPSILAPALSTSIAVMYAPLPAVMTAPTKALPS